METIKGTERIGNKDNDLLFVNFIATGQGDCIFIKTPLGRTVLIDAGAKPSENTTIRSVGELIFQDERLAIDPTLNELDLLILTHPDEDHYNRLVPLVFPPAFHTLGDKGKAESFTEQEIQDNLIKQHQDRPPWPFPRIKKVLVSTSISNTTRKGGNAWGVFASNLIYRHGTQQQLEAYFPLTSFPDRDEWGASSGVLEQIALNTPELAQNGPMVLIHETLPNGLEFKLKVLAAGVSSRPPTRKKRKRDEANLSSTADEKANELSIVTLLEYGEDRILLTADATVEVGNFLLRHFREHIQQVDLIQLPHHGSNATAMTTEFITCTQAKLVVCSAAYQGHVHGLPRLESILQYAEHAEPRNSAQQEGDDHPINADEDFIFCWYKLPEEKVTVKKRRGNQDEVYSSEVYPNLFPPGFTPSEQSMEVLKTMLWVHGKFAITKNLHVTGSLVRFDEITGRYVFGSNMELEFTGMPIQ